MTSQATNYLQHLLEPASEGYQQAWKEFLFNLSKVQELDKNIDPAGADAILKAGADWQGYGWNTTTASKALYELTGVALVTTDFKQYFSAWLYGLALHWKITVDQLDLNETAAAAAFALAQAMDGWEDQGPVHIQGTDDEMEDEDALADCSFEWEPTLEPLEDSRKALWQRYGVAGTRLDVKALLDNTPCFEGLPSRPQDNNHSGDGKGRLDRSLKATQGSLLHLLRLLASRAAG